MTVEYISATKDILLSIASVITATVAVIGLNSWRKELRGKAEYEVARRLIRATYKLRDELNYSRSPFIGSYEFPDGYDPIDKSASDEAKAMAFVYANRWKSIMVPLQEFEAQTLEAEVLWGKEIKRIAFQLKHCSSTLKNSMNAMVSNIANHNEHFNSNKEFAEKIQSNVWSGWSDSEEKDELSSQIITAVENIEKELRPHLKRN